MQSAPHLPEISLEVDALTCRRNGRIVLSGLDLAAGPGEVVWLRGPNGAGKSTLLLCLAGLIHHEGRVAWSGPGDEFSPAHHLHFAGHRHAVKPDLTLAENLAFWAGMFGGDPARIPDALSAAGLGGLEDFEARNLSAGQTHRLALARLLVAPRAVWLLDEPSSALDVDGDAWVAGLIEAHAAEGGLTIAATHRDIALADAAITRTITLGASGGAAP